LLQIGSASSSRAKQYLRQHHRRFVFGRGLRSFRRLPPAVPPSPDQLQALTYGWNNDGWSASPEFMQEVLNCAWQARGPILECGSGLSTLLLGIVADRTGATVLSLEHDGFWAEHVRSALKIHNIGSVEVHHAPLRSFGDHWWYSVEADALPDRIALVVCDGPPGDIPGGRYGLLPAARSRLANGCVLLLDDAARPDERRVVERWQGELGVPSTLLGPDKPFARLIVP